MHIFKTFITCFLLLIFVESHAQDFSKSWNQYFSYLDISVLDQTETAVYAAAENAIFSYDKLTGEIETISSVQGLSGEKISALSYVEDLDLLFVGFENGLIQIYNNTQKTIFNVVDIIDKPTILPNRKGINNFLYHNGIIYISADFGISEYDANALEFGDTFFIGNNGTQLNVNEIEIFDGFIYAATESGIRRALLTNPNLIDYQQWTASTSAHWTQINSVGDKLYATATNRRVYEVNYPTVIQKEVFPTSILDLSSYNDNLIVTTKSVSKWYDKDYSFVVDFLASDYNNAQFSVAIISQNNEVFIGTKGFVTAGQEGYGVLKTRLDLNTDFLEIHPSGPILNRVFQLDFSGNQIWAVHGSFSFLYGFDGGIIRTGISRLVDGLWNNIPYSRILQQVGNPFFINNVIINKFNSNKVYLSTYFTSGYLEFNNDELVEAYTEANSSLDPFVGVFYLTMTANYDQLGNLWVTNGRVDNSLNKFSNGVWEGIDLSSIITSASSNLGFAEMDFDQSGNVFLASSDNGVISYNVSTGLLTNIVGDANNMPSNDARALKIDRNNHVWVGLREGLRVIYNTQDFVNGNPEVESIIFLEDGIGSELFFQQFVNAIAIDGSNNKWIGTLNNGVFYLTPDGQETIYHFTQDNSPLPSDDILDIKINETTGEVFFATEGGMVSFKGTSSAPQVNLENAYIYPNPVRPGFNFDRDKIKITGLSENVNIKIVDIEGNLVIEAESKSNGKFNGFNLEVDGGTALWNGRNLANKIVASGVYVVLLNDLETFETNVLKVMIVR